MQYIKELKALNLKIGQYAIFGSGPMGIRKIRESADIDIVIRQNVWDDLISRYPSLITQKLNHGLLDIGNIQLCKSWPFIKESIDELIDDAEIIQDLPFVKLKYVIEWKKKHGRDKDKQDIKLINEYLKNQGK